MPLVFSLPHRLCGPSLTVYAALTREAAADPVLVAAGEAAAAERAWRDASDRLSAIPAHVRENFCLPLRRDMPEGIRLRGDTGITREEIEAANQQIVRALEDMPGKFGNSLDDCPQLLPLIAEERERGRRRLEWWDAENGRRQRFRQESGYAAMEAEEQALGDSGRRPSRASPQLPLIRWPGSWQSSDRSRASCTCPRRGRWQPLSPISNGWEACRERRRRRHQSGGGADGCCERCA